jgi:hypothetical protein
MPFALVPLLLAAALLPQDPAEPPDFTGRTVEELIALVQGQRDRVDPGVFKELARRGDRVAFAALQRCSTLVASPVGLEPVFDAVADLARTGRDRRGYGAIWTISSRYDPMVRTWRDQVSPPVETPAPALLPRLARSLARSSERVP